MCYYIDNATDKQTISIIMSSAAAHLEHLQQNTFNTRKSSEINHCTDIFRVSYISDFLNWYF